MTQWTSPAQPVRCFVDLTAPLTVRRERGVLVQGDKNANAIVVEAYQGKDVPYDLTGSTVTLTFVRPDKLAVSPIKAQITGNVAVMTLTEACYRYSGLYAASVELHNGETDRTIVRVLGDIISNGNVGVVDEEKLFPTPDELLETLLKVEQARTNAETAANRANTAAARAEQLQIDASGLAGDSNKLGGKPPEAYTAAQLLDNPDFAIAQAGYNKYHGNTLYHADRWYGNGSGYLSVSGGVKTFASSSGFASMGQKLWADGRDQGKPYTLVATLPDGKRIACSGTSPAAPATSEVVFADMYAPDARCWFNVMKAPDNSLVVRVDTSQAGASVSFLHLDLYEGAFTEETAPRHITTNPADELMRCRQYYREIKYLALRPYNVSSSARYYRVVLDPPMNRGLNPTVMILDAIETPLDSWSSTGAEYAVASADNLSFSLSATGDATGADFVLRVDVAVSNDL